ncbi:MAG: preprotein translocase subunit YajC, partial [Sphingomonadaceae bacterium]|nr:preprotein translocase subunit YajC [Sphingomonadaceae bacterium]
MTMRSHLLKTFAALSACLAAAAPAHAQLLNYGDLSAQDGSGDDSGEAEVDDADGRSPRLGTRSRKVTVAPYIEAQQVVSAELSPGDAVLTYSTLAAGIDANVAGRNSQGAVSVRYERRFGYGSNRVADSDVVSGVARASVGIVPRSLTLEGGAMAARLSVENNGSTVAGRESNSTSQIYGMYIGPSLRSQIGDLHVTGHYRFGYNRVESPGALVTAPGQNPADVYDEGTVHNAMVHAGVKPGTVLPIGVGVSAGWNREDVSNLDQRIDDKSVRGDVVLPVGSDLALVGGIGYEDVTVSNRDAVRDPVTGLPVIGADGRYVTDQSQPRQIAYESDGLTWDAGVIWRPSKRTALEAHVGRRYGST